MPKGGKKPTAPTAFYQAVVDAKRPKKSKLERVFGEEALEIRREAARMTESKPKSKGKGGKASGKGKRK